MYKLCLCTLLSLACLASANAQVTEETENYQGNLLKYPVVSQHKKGVDKTINHAISQALDKIKAQHASNKGAADEISMSYKLISENSDRLNLLLYSWTYNHGAAHGQYYTQGLSYDLQTGDKAEVADYLGSPKPEQLDAGIRSGQYQLCDGDHNPVKLDEFWKVDHVSKECLLNADGSLTLIYQIYDLAPYATGNTFLTIARQDFPELSGKPLPEEKPIKVKPVKQAKPKAPKVKKNAKQPAEPSPTKIL